jgi:Predicted GTPases
MLKMERKLLWKKVEARESFLRLMRHKFPFVPWARVVFCSSFDRKNLHVVLRVAKEIFQERQKRVSTGVLNNFSAKAVCKFLAAIQAWQDSTQDQIWRAS